MPTIINQLRHLITKTHEISGLISQNFENGFEFYIPPFDSVQSPFWPAPHSNPILAGDEIGISEAGGFQANGEELRFFGTNITAGAAFPNHDDGAGVARRLNSLGYNLVRFHHLEFPWGPDENIFAGQSHTLSLNPERVDKLDHFIAELKNQGIYINMNLHVSREFQLADGVVGADSIWSYGKGVTFFDPYLIQLQKNYAAQLLTHVNIHTGSLLAQDPALAVVEITNENSLYRMWCDGQLCPWDQGGVLLARHSLMLDSLWNAYLSEHYVDNDALIAAWGTGAGGGLDQIENGGFESGTGLDIDPPWSLQTFEGGEAIMLRDPTLPNTGAFAARIQVDEVTGTNWHVQLQQAGLSMAAGEQYAVTFAARSSEPANISIAIQLATSPWTYYTGTGFDITPEWQDYSFTLTSPVAVDENIFLAFHLGGASGIYWLDDVTFGEPAVSGLQPGEDLSEGSVQRIDFAQCGFYSENRVRDMSAFYLETMRRYFSIMNTFLKDSLGVTAPLEATNWSVGVPDYVVQSELDYMDNHTYWDHPWFPENDWSPINWQISNTPMVTSGENEPLSAVLTGGRLTGKPYTISEYNHPFPNRYQSEGILFLAAYAAFQDVDGLMFYDYSGESNWTDNFITSYFDQHRNPAMMALMPSCSRAYRQGLVQSAEQTLMVHYHSDDALLWAQQYSGWSGPEYFDPKLAFVHGMRVDTYAHDVPGDHGDLPPTPVNPYSSDTGEITWDTNGLLKIAAPAFVGLAGFLQDYPGTAAGNLTLVEGSDFAVLTWIDANGGDLDQSSHSLLTLATTSQNTDMVWDGIHTIHDDWGHAPVVVRPVTVTLEFAIEADSMAIHPLLPSGLPQEEYYLVLPQEDERFRVTLDQEIDGTMWYGLEIFRVIPGDVNMDGDVDILDVVQLVFWVLGDDQPSAEVLSAGDVNGDAVLNVLDVVQLVDMILNNTR